MNRQERAFGKKMKLLRMAVGGKDRPCWRTTELGACLKRYITPSSTSFDKFFLEKLLVVAPGWFRRGADEKKAKLLHLAKRGSERPPYGTPLGNVLKFYTTPGASSYDEEFTNKVLALSPGWFRRAV